MLTAREQTAWEPSYFPHADRAPPLGGTAEGAEPAATQSSAPLPLIGLLVVLALASAIQAALYPELLGEIFARL